jgi:spore germination protein GerM
VALRVVGLALLLLLVLVGTLVARSLQRMPDTVVYLVRSDERTLTLESVVRRLRPADEVAGARAAVEALVEGPTAAETARGLSSELPPDTRVLDVFWDDDVLVVDLSGDVTRGGGSASMIGRLAQLTYTLTQPAAVDAVELRLEGAPVDVWGGEGVMMTWPWRRPAGGLPRW